MADKRRRGTPHLLSIYRHMQANSHHTLKTVLRGEDPQTHMGMQEARLRLRASRVQGDKANKWWSWASNQVCG